MKTAVILERSLMGQKVRQRSDDMMLNAGDLHAIANEARKARGMPEKQMGAYFNLQSTSELIAELQLSSDLDMDRIKTTRRGKMGGTWVHPILFMDMAMWYSPEFKVKIIGWVVDNLVGVRNDSGDSYRSMCDALTTNYPEQMGESIVYARIASRIAAACGVPVGGWETATVEQLERRDRIHKNAILLAGVAKSMPDCVNHAIAKA